MKKIIIALLLLPWICSAVFAADYYVFDFNDELFPTYSELTGKWEIDGNNVGKEYTFEDKEQDFLPISGLWRVSDGKYTQSQVGFSALTKSMLPKSYDGFVLSFEVTPKSDDNTLMIYFASKNGTDGFSAEINSYQSKLIAGSKEVLGKGGILPQEVYKIMLVSENKTVRLYLNDEIILEDTDMSDTEGRIGIGSWNSAFEFDNVYVQRISPLGNGKKLIGSGKKAELMFNQLSAENFTFTAKAAAEAVGDGAFGIIARGTDSGDGYYFGLDANGAYISKKENGAYKKLQRAEFKTRSGKMYELSAVCDGKNLSLLIDGKETVSVKDGTFSQGACGFFEADTKIFCENVRMELINKIFPPIISDGDTVYYVNSENGDDLNDGKSEKNAWKTLGRLQFCTFAEGDKVLLKSGGVYEGTLTLNNIRTGFEISSYGNGAAPVITACSKAIEALDCKDIVISGIDVSLRHYAADKFSTLGAGFGIKLVNSENISLVNCNFKGPGENTYTYAAETDSIFNEPILENVNFTDFGVNSLCIGESPSESDNTDNSHWAYKYMNLLVKKNIISEYRPEDNITRAEFSSMLVSALGLNQSEYRGIFKDVTSDMWYAGKIQTVSDYRFLPTEMTDEGKAEPNTALKRAELAAMAALASQKPLNTYTATAEEECEAWMQRYIAASLDMGFMSKDENGNFNPYKEVTRAEASVVLIKLMEERDIT